MARAYNKKVRSRNFEVMELILRRILSHYKEAKGKFAPNTKSSYIIRKLLLKGALYLGYIKGNYSETTIKQTRSKSIMCNPFVVLILSNWDDEGNPKHFNHLLTLLSKLSFFDYPLWNPKTYTKKKEKTKFP